MKANELRIGNLVYAFKTVWQVDNTCFTNVDKLETYKPLPLTEEWLYKLGFENDDGVFSLPDHNTGYFEVIKLRAGIDLRERFELSSHDFNPHLDYVHQLQNLHFALTGEELTLRLPS